MRRIRAFSGYALTKLDYITHGAVFQAPSLTNLQVITNRHFRCVYRLPKWAPSDSQMDSRQMQPNCNSKEQPSMQTQQALGGVFAQRAHIAVTAPTITVIIRVTAPKTTYQRNHAQPIRNSKIQTSDACHRFRGPKLCSL